MATLTQALQNDLLNQILPTYGSPRAQVPVWNEGQRMFICGEYESNSGNRYYKGVRFSDRIVVVEKVGLYHTWTYLDGLEIYAFNGKRLELVQKRDYEKAFRNDEFVRAETESMVGNYLEGMLKLRREAMSKERLEALTKETVENCYKSFLDNNFGATRLTQQIIPQLEQK